MSIPPISSPPLGTRLQKPSGESAPSIAREEKRLESLKAAVDSLKAQRDDPREARKSAARAKLEQIRAMIRMLQFGGTADPKLLAELARSLKAAVQAYVDAGGKGAEAISASAGVQANTSANTPPVVPSDAASVAGPVTADEAAQPSQFADSGEPGSGNEDDAETPAAMRRALAEAAQAYGRAAAAGAASKEADRDFLTMARGLARDIALLAKSAARAMDPQERRALEDALREVDRQVGQALSGAAAAVAPPPVAVTPG